MKTLLTAFVLGLCIVSNAYAAKKPLTDKQMDAVTAGDATAFAQAFGVFTLTNAFVSTSSLGSGVFQFNSTSFSSSFSP
jgi:hypothetical protein